MAKAFSNLTNTQIEQIIYLLSLDSRRPVSELARQVGMKYWKVEDRIKRLQGKGLISLIAPGSWRNEECI